MAPSLPEGILGAPDHPRHRVWSYLLTRPATQAELVIALTAAGIGNARIEVARAVNTLRAGAFVVDKPEGRLAVASAWEHLCGNGAAPAAPVNGNGNHAPVAPEPAATQPGAPDLMALFNDAIEQALAARGLGSTVASASTAPAAPAWPDPATMPPFENEIDPSLRPACVHPKFGYPTCLVAVRSAQIAGTERAPAVKVQVLYRDAKTKRYAIAGSATNGYVLMHCIHKILGEDFRAVLGADSPLIAWAATLQAQVAAEANQRPKRRA